MFGVPAASGGGLFGQAPASASQPAGMFGAAQAAAPGPPAGAMLMCEELHKRMQDLQPVLQQSSGRPAPGAGGGAPSALQSSFVAYTYSTCEDPQRLAQANSMQFNPAIHHDYAKWVQAMQNNPDPSSCYPEPLVGLPALETRVGRQQQAVEACTASLEELRAGFGNLKDALQAQSLQKLEECRRRHQVLSRQLLQVVAAVETFASASGAVRHDPQAEARLDSQLARLEEAVHAPASARARLEELWVVLRGLLQRGAPNGGAARLADAEAEKTLKLSASQGELLELLQEDVARQKKDITQFENALARFSNSSAQAGTGIQVARPALQNLM